MISIGILLAILFLLMITIFILPTIEDNIFDERKTQVQEMVNAGLGVLEHYHEQEVRGELSRDEAQMRARAVIGSMLYGPGNQDYFWINDFEPVIGKLAENRVSLRRG